jgi:hypothetical protein
MQKKTAGTSPPPRPKGQFWSRVWTALRRCVTLGLHQSVREMVCCPAPGGHPRNLEFNPLPATGAEAEQIAAVFGVRACVGTKADEGRLTGCRSV